MFISVTCFSQELQTLDIPIHTSEGDGGYTWNPDGGCEGITPTGNIVAKWVCTPGTAPELSFDFTGFNFVNTATNTVIDPNFAYVYQWEGPTAANEWQSGGSIPPPPVPEYLSTMQAGPYAMPTNIPQGKLNITMRFVIEEFTFGSDYPGTQCFADIVLPEIDFTCPGCLDPAPVAKAVKIDRYLLRPGPLYDVENHTVIEDISISSNYQREWDVYYGKYNNSTGIWTWWHEYSNQPTIDVIYSAYDIDPPYILESMGAFSLTLRVWNCNGESTINIPLADPRPEERSITIGDDFQPIQAEVFPNIVKAGDMLNINIEAFSNDVTMTGKLVDLKGSVVKEQLFSPGTDMQLSTSVCTPGIYILMISDNRGFSFKEKIMVY